MLHNKYYRILTYFLGDYNRKIYGRELISKVNISQKNIAISLIELETQGILKSEKKGNMKFYSLNFKYLFIKDVLNIIETQKKLEFLSKHKAFANLFKDDNRIVGVFGSFAKDINRQESDLDIFILGEKIAKDYDKLGKIFDLNVHILYLSERMFKTKGNPLINEIMLNHVLIFGIEKFVDLAWYRLNGV